MDPMRKRGWLIAVEGASGAGKTTLVRTAAKKLGWEHLFEAFDRLDPAPSLEFEGDGELLLLEGSLLAEEVRRYREAVRVCARGRTVVADTGFLGPLTYTRGLIEIGRAPTIVGRWLERSARSLVTRGALGIPDLTIYLRTAGPERRSRARSDAAHHPRSLAARHEAVGRVERRLFEEAFPSALPDRFRTLRANEPPSALVDRMTAVVEEVRPTRASRADALELLSLLTSSSRRSKVVPNR